MEENKKRAETIASIPLLLPAWFRANARVLPWRRDKDPYHVWLSEIMLQQTRVEAVISYYERFLTAAPDIGALSELEDEKLMKLWEGLGYYSRARNLKKTAQKIMTEFGGVFPTTYEDIRSLPGIGPYTAGAIASICCDLPYPAVDGNVLRVFTRLTADGANTDEPQTKKRIEQSLIPIYRQGICSDLTQGLMELGACVCVPNGEPKCGVCPLNGSCMAHTAGNERDYPVKGKKKARKIVNKLVLLLIGDGRITLCQREASGLLAGLWEFPNRDYPSPEAIHENAAGSFAAALGAKPTELLRKTTYTHVFTHVEWRMTAFCFSCSALPDTLPAFTLREIERERALPSAFRPFLDFSGDLL